MKYVILLGDGMADRPLDYEHDRTPLAISNTPTMDELARHGTLGIAGTIPPGMEPGSDVANLSVLGYDPLRYYTGRAPIEAASIGVPLGEHDVAFRCNLVTLRNENGTLVMDDYSAGHIGTDDAAVIIGALKEALDSPDISFHAGVSYRHLMLWRNGHDGMKTLPPHDISDKPIEAYLPWSEGSETIRNIMDRAQRIIPDLDLTRDKAGQGLKTANAIWLWGQGKKLTLPFFRDKYGISGAVISAVDLIKGLGLCAGLTPISVPGATGYLDTNYTGKVTAALRALRDEDFVYLHVEAPDEASHSGSLENKIKAIQDFDEKIVRPIRDGLESTAEPYSLMVLPDHPTPLSMKTHSSDPVPFIIYRRGDESSGSQHPRGYSEKEARGTGLSIDEGWRLMDLFVRGQEK